MNNKKKEEGISQGTPFSIIWKGNEISQGRPSTCSSDYANEKAVYDFLDSAEVDYVTLKHAAAFTMEECEAVRNSIGAPVFKNLFLTNKQQTRFYLLLMPPDKPFKTKYLSSQIGSARLSFATEAHMTRLLGVHPGAVTPLGLIFDEEKAVQLLIDKDLAAGERYACHPCVNTASVGMSFKDLLTKVIPSTGHSFQWVELPSE